MSPQRPQRPSTPVVSSRRGTRMRPRPHGAFHSGSDAFESGGGTLQDSPLNTNVLTLCQHKAGFVPAYDVPQCVRTSNRSDRLMRGMEKSLSAHQGFHGTLVSAAYGIRASCLLTNVRPSLSHPVVGTRNRNCQSPCTQLNGFTYHTCWLQNMLVATSGQAVYRFRHKKVG